VEEERGEEKKEAMLTKMESSRSSVEEKAARGGKKTGEKGEVRPTLG